MFDCCHDVLFMKCCVSFTPDVTGRTPSKKFLFCLVSPQNIFPEVLGIIKMFFWRMWDEPLCSFWSAVVFTLELSHGCIFAQSLSYCRIINTDLNWGEWGLQIFRCCSGFFCDLLDESSMRSWSNFGRPASWEGSPLFQVFSICGYWLSLWFTGVPKP